MKLFFLFLFLILSIIPLTTAIGFSPSSLTFFLEPNQEFCQIVTLNSESKAITVFDSWAKNEKVEWKASLFNTTAKEHSLTVTYPNQLLLEEREAKVCISGLKEGEYHGAIIFEQEQEGNSIIQLTVWLKVIIKEKAKEQPKQQKTNLPASSGGGSSATITKPTTNSTNTTAEPPYIQQLSTENTKTPNQQDEELFDAGITGNVINSSGDKNRYSAIIIISIIIILISLIIYQKRRQSQ